LDSIRRSQERGYVVSGHSRVLSHNFSTRAIRFLRLFVGLRPLNPLYEMINFSKNNLTEQSFFYIILAKNNIGEIQICFLFLSHGKDTHRKLYFENLKIKVKR
jgi:hypothetical protein